MGYLGEMSDGNYILYVEVGCVTVIKIFKPAEISLDEISKIPCLMDFICTYQMLKAAVMTMSKQMDKR